MTSKDKKTIALISGGIIIATPRFLRNLSKLKRNIEVMKRQNEIMNEISEWKDCKRNVNDKLDECRDKLKNDKSMSKEEKEALKHGIATTVNCLNVVNRMKCHEWKNSIAQIANPHSTNKKVESKQAKNIRAIRFGGSRGFGTSTGFDSN